MRLLNGNSSPLLLKAARTRSLASLTSVSAKPTKVKPLLDLSPFQPVKRDFAFLVGREVAAADVLKAAQGVDKKLITDVSVFDVYEGAGVAEDKKSVAIEVTLQPRERTLTDVEIEAVAAKIVADVSKKTGAALRG